MSETIAVLADVHGNGVALKAVLEDIKMKGIQRVWNLGDMIGYGADPDFCVQQLSETCEISIAGNYDQKVLKIPTKKHKWAKTKDPTKLKAQIHAYENLSESSKQIIEALPETKRVTMAGRHLLLCHGSPESNKEAIWAYTPRERLIEIAQEHQHNTDMILSGHIHQTFARLYEGVWFVNTSTVGRSEDLDPRATYATLHLNESDSHAPPLWQWHRVPYNYEQAAQRIIEEGLPEAFAYMVRHGICLRHWRELSHAQRHPLPEHAAVDPGTKAKLKTQLQSQMQQ